MKNKTIQIRLTEEQYNIIDGNRRRSGFTSLSEFSRVKLMEGSPELANIKDPEPVIKEPEITKFH